MATGGYDVVVKFGADLSALKKGFAEAGGEASVLDSKVKNLSGSTSSIKSEPVSKLKTEMQETSKATTPVISGLKDSKVALNDIKNVDAFEKSAVSSVNLKSALQSTSKEAKGLNSVMKAFGDSGSPILKEVGATTRLGAAFTGDAQGAGLLSVVMGSFGGILLPVIAIVAGIAAAFAVLYATSKTFRDVVGQAVAGIMQIVNWVKILVGDLMSGNFSKFGDDLKAGFVGAFNVLKNFDYGSIGSTIVKIFSESATTIGTAFLNAFNTLKSIDWGGILAGALDAVSKFLDTLLNFDPTPMINALIDAIGKAFDSLFGSPDAKGNVGGQVSKSVAKAGPDILGKLGNVFIKLLELLPVIFGKIALALFNAMSKVDWGTVFGKIGTAIMNALKSVDWGGIVMGLLIALGGAAAALGAALLKALGQVNWTQIFTLIFVTLKFFGTAILNAFKVIDWGKAFDTLKTALSGILTSVAAPFGTALGSAANTVKTVLTSAVTSAVSFLTSGWTTLVNTVKSILGGAVSTAVSGLTSGWTTLVNTVRTVLTGAVSTAVSSLTSGWNTIVNTVRTVLTGAVTTAVSSLTSGWNSIVNTVKTVLTGAVSTAVSSLTSGWNAIVNTVRSVLGSAVSSAVSALTSGWNSAVNTVKTVLGGAVSSAVNAIQSGFNTAVNTIKEGISGIAQTLSSDATNFGNGLKDAVTTGLSNMAQMVKDAAGGFGNALVTALQGVADQIKNAIIGIFTAVSIPVHFTIPIINRDVDFTINLAEGAVVGAAPGGRIVRVAEAGEAEAIVPGRRIGESWDSLLHGPNKLPSLASGAIIGSVSVPSTRGVTSAGKTGDTYVYEYNTNVSVDSEDLTRRMFKAFRANEDYNQLGRM